jgi:hypothetical protein
MDNDNNIQTALHQFWFETGLYDKINMDESQLNNIIILLYKTNITAYNQLLKSETTYEPRVGYPSFGSTSSMGTGYHIIDLHCKRIGSTIRFYLYKTKTTLEKVGQYPSFADLQKIDKDFEKELKGEDKLNYTKALGLYSHGVNIGAYAYLRRIFENLVISTFNSNTTTVGKSYEEFMKLKMEEKIKILESYLPESLVEFKSFYGIVSKGIHELSEEECRKYFEILKNIIDMSIKENIIKKQEVQRKKELKKALKQAQQELSNSN